MMSELLKPFPPLTEAEKAFIQTRRVTRAELDAVFGCPASSFGRYEWRNFAGSQRGDSRNGANSACVTSGEKL